MMGARPAVELSTDNHDRTPVVGTWSSTYYAPEATKRARDLVDEAQATREKIATHEARLAVIVQELRQCGASWAVVGHALGITKAAAYKRFGKDELA